MKNKALLLAGTLLLFLGSCDKLGFGSYGSETERYKVSASRDGVIQAIKQLKIEHPEICPPDECKLEDGYHKDIEGRDITTWYYVVYYNPDTKRYFNTWVTPDGDIKSVIGLISVTQDLSVKWQIINKDLSQNDRVVAKQEFVVKVLNPLKAILSR